MKDEAKYPIKAVSKLTGLSQHVIRAWEKRYQAIQPTRTGTNRRLYSEEEINRLRLLKEAIAQGHNIGNVANMDSEDLKTLITGNGSIAPAQTQPETAPNKPGVSNYLDELIAATQSLDNKRIERILLNASVTLSQPLLIDQLIIPFLQKIGELWQEGSLRIFHEHLASAVIRTFLADLLATIKTPSHAPILIVTTPSGQYHEIGALIVALTSASVGWQVTYLGPNLPAEEISAAAIEKNARIVLLSIVFPPDDPHLKLELERIRVLLPDNISIFVGGRASSSYLETFKKINATVFSGIKTLRTNLESYHSS